MPLVRRVARPLLASVFIYDGVDALRNADARVPAMDRVVGDRPVNIPGINTTADLVRADAAAKIAGGALLALGKLPRLAAQTQTALERHFPHPHEVVDVVGSQLEQWFPARVLPIAGHLPLDDSVADEHAAIVIENL